MFQLDAQHRRLERVQPAVQPDRFVDVLRAAAVDPQHADPVGECLIVGDDHAAVPEPAEVLGGKEAEAPRLPERAGLAVPPRRPDRLRGVLDHRDFLPSCDLQNRLHLGTLAEQVHRHEGLGPRRNGPFEQRGIHVVGVRLDVHEHRLRPQARDGAGRGKERVRHRDHFISRPHAAGHERQ